MKIINYNFLITRPHDPKLARTAERAACKAFRFFAVPKKKKDLIDFGFNRFPNFVKSSPRRFVVSEFFGLFKVQFRHFIDCM